MRTEFSYCHSRHVEPVNRKSTESKLKTLYDPAGSPGRKCSFCVACSLFFAYFGEISSPSHLHPLEFGKAPTSISRLFLCNTIPAAGLYLCTVDTRFKEWCRTSMVLCSEETVASSFASLRSFFLDNKAFVYRKTWHQTANARQFTILRLPILRLSELQD